VADPGPYDRARYLTYRPAHDASHQLRPDRVLPDRPRRSERIRPGVVEATVTLGNHRLGRVDACIARSLLLRCRVGRRIDRRIDTRIDGDLTGGLRRRRGRSLIRRGLRMLRQSRYFLR